MMTHRRYSKSLFYFVISLTVLACSDIKLGSGDLDDPVPNGTITAIGSFSGGSITGTASIYLLSSGQNVLRLESFSSATNSGLFVTTNTSTQEVLNTPLKGTGGNQNYTTNISGSQTWSAARIENGQGTIVSTATLQAI